MENASRALMIAVSVLVGVLIISFAVFLYSIYVDFARNTAEKTEKNLINEFNIQFTKYYGMTITTNIDINGKEENVAKPILCSIHDIVSLANLAKENNIKYEMNGTDYLNFSGKDTSLYVKIDLKIESNMIENFERKSLQDMTDIIKNYSLDVDNKNIINFKCTECKISDVTKRVYYMKFEKC